MDLLSIAIGISQAVGSWFASIGMTVSDVLAVATAAGALALSYAALRQTSKHRPQPRFAVEWGKDAYQYRGVIVVAFVMINIGTAAARNVRVNVKAEGIVCKLTDWMHWDKFEDGKREGFEIPLEPAIRDWTEPYLERRPRDIEPARGSGPATRPGDMPRRAKYLRPVVTIEFEEGRKVRARAPKIETLRLREAGRDC